MKIIRTLLIAASFAGSLVTAANATSVAFTFTYGGSVYGSGSFVGVDTNSDGKLSKPELTSFSSDVPSENIFGLSLSDLFDFGTYTISTNTWNADASGWGLTNFAWYSWNSGNSSVNPSWAVMTTAADQGTVPEPESLALVGLGLAGLAVARRRKSV